MLNKLPPRVAQTIYNVGLLATSLLTIASIWNWVSGDTSSAVAGAITSLLSLLGVGATTTGSVRVANQRKDGTLDFSGPAAQQAVDAINAVTAQAQAAASDLDAVKAAAGTLAASIPVVGPLARQVIDSVQIP
jgi:hypothetical protein